jgi:hypothetical protein
MHKAGTLFASCLDLVEGLASLLTSKGGMNLLSKVFLYMPKSQAFLQGFLLISQASL